MKKALLLAPMGSVHRRFNSANILALKELGYEIHLVANFENGDGPEIQNSQYTEKCGNSGLVVHTIPFKRHSFWKNRPYVKQIAELIRDGGFSLVHAHTETGGLILRLVGRISGVKYYYTPHGMSFYKGSSIISQLVYRPLEWWICGGMDMNIAINEDELAVLKHWNPNTATLVHGIGLDIKRFQNVSGSREAIRVSLEIPLNALVVLSVGELDWNKNHTVVIDALAQLNRKDVFYLICGVGPNHNSLLEKARNLGLEQQVKLLGYRKDIPELLHASDVFAFPSYHEGLPVSLMEAMAAGIPAVASDIRGCVDLIENTKGGYLANPSDCQQWVQALGFLFESVEKRKQISCHAKSVVMSYSFDAVKQELLSLYQID